METVAPRASKFATLVPTIDRFPVWIQGAGWVLVLLNVIGVTGFSSTIPGLLSTGADAQATLMLASRQLSQAFIFAYGLLQKNVRLMQFLWVMAIIRETIDLVARLQRGQGLSLFAFAITLVIEIAAFMYLGAIASGHIASYRKK